MSIQSIASVASMPAPEPGQKNRSSPNFKFVDVPASGEISSTFIAVDNPSAVLATLMQDKRLGNDVIISLLTQNGSFPAGKVNTTDSYYIASPDDVSSNFVVNFEADV
jgi:hypothetical protein